MKIQVEEFAFTNIPGGTGHCCQKGKKFGDIISPDVEINKPITVTITKSWGDYEIGRRFIGKLSTQDFNLIKKYTKKNEVYIGEFDKGFKIIKR